MPYITFHIKRTGLLAITKTQYNALLKEAWNQVGIYWHEHFREKHFSQDGAREYGYAPRSGESGRVPKGGQGRRTYTGRKKTLMGHTRPLEFTGVSRARARLRKVYPTRNGVRVAIDAPAFNFRPKTTPGNPSAVDMRHDMTKVSEPELQFLARQLKAYIAARLQSGEYEQRTTIQ